jgi:hypothetical protein
MSTLRVNTIQDSTGSSSPAINGLAKAWVNFNGTGTVAIRASLNVSSITDRGTGAYTMNFSTSMPDSNYSAVFGVTGTNAYEVFGGRSSSAYQINTENNSYTQFDADQINITIFR